MEGLFSIGRPITEMMMCYFRKLEMNYLLFSFYSIANSLALIRSDTYGVCQIRCLISLLIS